MKLGPWLVAALLILVPATGAIAQESVTTQELDADPGRFADRRLTIVGELIGDYGRRGDSVWVQLNDDAYVTEPLTETGKLAGTNSGIGVRIPATHFGADWGEPGRYGVRGPIVRVVGFFRYHDVDTAGETFIDVTSTELIERSRRIDVGGLEPVTFISGGAMIVVGIGLYLLGRWRTSPRR